MPAIAIVSAFRAPPPASGDVDHVLARLAAAEAAASPFPHAVVRDLLPDDLFAALRAAWPETPDVMQSVKQRRGDAEYSDLRFSRALPPPAATEAASLAEPVRRLQRLLCSERVVAALLRSFAGVVNPRLTAMQRRLQRPHVGIGMGIELIYDRSGFELVPHTDGNRKLVTGLLYAAEPDDPPELGTVLYKSQDRDLTSDGNGPVPRDRLRPAVRAPYEPNLFVCFARSDRSFHGVEATASDRARRLVQYSIFSAA